MTSSQHGIFAGAKPEYRVFGGIEPWAWRAREREPITEPLVEGQGREAPLKLKTFYFLDAQRKQQICLILSEL